MRNVPSNEQIRDHSGFGKKLKPVMADECAILMVCEHTPVRNINV
jgi:hypothetical protein